MKVGMRKIAFKGDIFGISLEFYAKGFNNFKDRLWLKFEPAEGESTCFLLEFHGFLWLVPPVRYIGAYLMAEPWSHSGFQGIKISFSFACCSAKSHRGLQEVGRCSKSSRVKNCKLTRSEHPLKGVSVSCLGLHTRGSRV